MTTQWKETSSRFNNKNFNYVLVNTNTTLDNINANKLDTNLLLTTTISCETIFANTVFLDNLGITDNLSVNNVIVDDLNIHGLLKSNTIVSDNLISNTYYSDEISANNIVCDDLVITGNNPSFTNFDIKNILETNVFASKNIFTNDITSSNANLNNEFLRNNIQDVTINAFPSLIVPITIKNSIQDISLNKLDSSFNQINNKNTIQDISISQLDVSLNEQINIDNNQTALINSFINGLTSISNETITLPSSQTVISHTIPTTIVEGIIETNITLTLANGTTENFIKTIDLTRLSINNNANVTLSANLRENNVNISSRLLNSRLKLIWNSSRWVVLGDEYFIENGDSSIYTLSNVGINTTTPAYNLDVNGSIRSRTFIQSSDKRLKENITSIENALDKISKLRCVSFNYINLDNNETNKEIGFIAQEVEPIFPELVLDNSEFKSVKYQNITAVLVEAVKEVNEISIQVEERKKHILTQLI
jgi:hypothetical protein